MTGLRELRRDLPLGVGELARFELEIAERAAPLVGPRGLQTPLELAQLLERTARARARLRRILPAQIARRIAHRFGHVAHLARLT